MAYGKLKLCVLFKRISKKGLIFFFFALLKAIILAIVLPLTLRSSVPEQAIRNSVSANPSSKSPIVNVDQQNDNRLSNVSPVNEPTNPPPTYLTQIENLKKIYDAIPRKTFAAETPSKAADTPWPEPGIENGRSLLTVKEAEAKINFQQNIKRKQELKMMADQALREKNSIVFENLQKRARNSLQRTQSVGATTGIGFSSALLTHNPLCRQLKSGSLAIVLNQEIQKLLSDYYFDAEIETGTNALRMEKLIALGFKKLRGNVTFNIYANASEESDSQARVDETITMNGEMNLEQNSPQVISRPRFNGNQLTKKRGGGNLSVNGLNFDKKTELTIRYQNGTLIVTNCEDELTAGSRGAYKRQRFEWRYTITLSVTSLNR